MYLNCTEQKSVSGSRTQNMLFFVSNKHAIKMSEDAASMTL